VSARVDQILRTLPAVTPPPPPPQPVVEPVVELDVDGSMEPGPCFAADELSGNTGTGDQVRAGSTDLPVAEQGLADVKGGDAEIVAGREGKGADSAGTEIH
jgi:hypothetical protein